MQETFELIAGEIWRQMPQDAPCTGIVLSGGGSQLDGIVALAEEVFVKRARLGELEGLVDATHLLQSPELPARSPAVAMGLLAYAQAAASSDTHVAVRDRGRSEGMWSRFKRQLLTKRGGV
jgi:cell division ATPase FtsA